MLRYIWARRFFVYLFVECVCVHHNASSHQYQFWRVRLCLCIPACDEELVDVNGELFALNAPCVAEVTIKSKLFLRMFEQAPSEPPKVTLFDNPRKAVAAVAIAKGKLQLRAMCTKIQCVDTSNPATKSQAPSIIMDLGTSAAKPTEHFVMGAPNVKNLVVPYFFVRGTRTQAEANMALESCEWQTIGADVQISKLETPMMTNLRPLVAGETLFVYIAKTEDTDQFDAADAASSDAADDGDDSDAADAASGEAAAIDKPIAKAKGRGRGKKDGSASGKTSGKGDEGSKRRKT